MQESGLPQRLTFIDSLRGWAILLVLLVHVSQGALAVAALETFRPQLRSDLALPAWLGAICGSAGHGVQLFFVVSAASLTLSALRQKQLELKMYARRRFFRIAPLFYLAIAFYLLVYGTGPRLFAPAGIGLFDIAVTGLFLHGWFSNSFNSVVPGDWSIGDEVSFYALLPILLVLLRHSPLLFGAGTLAATAAAQVRYVAAVGQGAWSAYEYFGFMNQLPVFLLGMLSGWCIHCDVVRIPARLASAGSIALVIAMIGLLPQQFIPPDLVEPHLAFAALAAMLCVALSLGAPRALDNRAIAELGRCSFSIYLVHFIILRPAHYLAQLVTADRGATYLALAYSLVITSSYVVAATTYRLVELPFIRLGAGGRQEAGSLLSRSPTAGEGEDSKGEARGWAAL